jgi:hypothetical protein
MLATTQPTPEQYGSSQQDQQWQARAPAALTFHSAPEDVVVQIVITFLLRLDVSPIWKKVVTIISVRSLLCACRHQPPILAARQTYGDEDGEQDEEGEEGEGTAETDRYGAGTWVYHWGPPAPAPHASSSHPLSRIPPHTSSAGSRHKTGKLIVRDFSAARVRRTRAYASGGAPAYRIRHMAGAGAGTGTRTRTGTQQPRFAGTDTHTLQTGTWSELPFFSFLEGRGETGFR